VRRTLPFVLAAGAACAHADLKDATAPEVGCDAEAIEILGSRGTGLRSTGGPESWTARCEDREWFCSRLHQRSICTTVPPGFTPAQPAPEEPRPAGSSARETGGSPGPGS
jgi:hypothetical protein